MIPTTGAIETGKPSIYRGLWCTCGARHHQEGSYYVTVVNGSSVVFALGPFQEHGQALARVEDVNREVQAKWNPDGRAHFYGFGTACVGYDRVKVPGKLNATLLDA